MLSFKFVTNAGGAAHYFENTDDYYTKEGHRGIWQGAGAEKLGLVGGVEREVFKNLLEGRLPNGEVARKRMPKTQKDGKVSKERLGIDFTFSAPKSVSIAALVNGDERLLRAHDEAVSAALKQLEARALARKKDKGISFRLHTANLAFATFRHELSRTQDPQLHTHSVAMNLTQREDGKWVALTNDEMLKSIKVVGAFYRADLAKRLEAMGYELRTTRNGFELADISDKAIKIFSTRSQQIEEALKSKGLDRDSANSKTKQTITKATRPNKTEADRAELKKEWEAMLREAGIRLKPAGAGESIKEKVQEIISDIERKVLPKRAARREEETLAVQRNKARWAVDLSIEHLMERQGIFTRDELLEKSLTNALAAHEGLHDEIDAAIKDGRIIAELPLYQSAKSFVREQEVEAHNPMAKFFKAEEATRLTASSWIALTMANTGRTQQEAQRLVNESIKAGRLVRTELRFTTRAMLDDELKIQSKAAVGRSAVIPIRSTGEVDAMLSGTNLNEGQKSAARLILTTEDRIVGVQGWAGVGKSHMLKQTVDAIQQEAAKAMQQQGYEVIGLAPYASQNKALAELGMKSQTLASFLMRKQDHVSLHEKSVVFLDEASVVPAHQMRDLIEKIEARNARLVLIGDIKQTQAVEAGKPFQQLVEGGMAVAHITEIQRQKNAELKAAVVSAVGGNVREAAAQLESRIHEYKDDADRHAAIAKHYTSLTEDQRNSTLVVVGTNDARRSINEKVRSVLNLSRGDTVATLESVDMTRAEKKVAGNFQVDQVVVFEAAKRGGRFERGEQYVVSVVDTVKNLLTVLGPDKKPITFNPAEMRNFSTYSQEQLTLSPGDWIRMTRNNNRLGIANGERYKVEAVTATSIKLQGGVELPRDRRLHMQYGYAMTIHSAQGLTMDHVIMDINTDSLTSNRAVFYVGMSRPRHELAIYTNNKAKLPDAVAREPKKYAALELRGKELEQKFLAQEMSRQELMNALRQTKKTTQSGTQTKKRAAKSVKR